MAFIFVILFLFVLLIVAGVIFWRVRRLDKLNMRFGVLSEGFANPDGDEAAGGPGSSGSGMGVPTMIVSDDGNSLNGGGGAGFSASSSSSAARGSESRGRLPFPPKPMGTEEH